MLPIGRGRIDCDPMACRRGRAGRLLRPILFQMYVLFPFVYAAFRKRPLPTFLAFLVANIMWEAAFAGGIVSDQAYRLLIFRYLVFLLMGAWFYRLWSSDRARLTGRSLSAALACCLAGAGYLAAVNYLGLPPLAGGVWMSTSWITALYSGSVFYVLLAAYAGLADGRSRQPGRVSRCVEYLSKAALHVYLFQMLYFYFLNVHLQKLAALPLWEVVVGSVLVCVIVGVVLYWCESLVRRRVKRFRAQTAALRELDPAEAVIPR